MFRFIPKLSQYTIRFTVVSIFILATVVTATIAISLQYHFSKKMATESASELFSLSSQNTQKHLHDLDQKAEDFTRIFAKFAHFVDGNKMTDSTYSLFSEMLTGGSEFYSAYIGFDNGDFYELINLEASPKIRQQMKASFTDRWITLAITGEKTQRKRIYSYLNEDFSVRTVREEYSNYYANIRPWYINAQLNDVYKTKPYMFQNLQAPGQTYSIKIPNSNAVLAIDIALSSIDEYLKKQSVTRYGDKNKDIYLFQKSGEIISSNQRASNSTQAIKVDKIYLTDTQKELITNTPVLNVSNESDWAPIDFSISGEPKGYSIEVLSLISKMTGLQFEFINGFTWLELMKGFESQNIDILQPIFKTDDNNQQGIYSDPFVNLPFAIITKPNTPLITHINQLQDKTLAIPQGWSIIKTIKHYFPRINIIEYPSTKAVLEAVLKGDVFAGIENEVIFRYTQEQFFIKGIQYHLAFDFSPANLNSTLHFMLHESQGDLIDIINLAINSITDKQKHMLKESWLTTNNKKDTPPIQSKQGVVPYAKLIELAKNDTLYGELVPIDIDNIAHFIYLTPVNQDETEFLAMIVTSEVIFASSNAKVKLSIIITATCLFFVLPMSWLFSSPIVTPIKLLAVENEKIKNRKYDTVRHIPSHIKEINELANSLVDMSVSIKNHELKQQELMDSFIKLIAQTIDDKSAYTGGHCNRVPELGLLLVDVVIKDDNHFKDFTFKSEDEYREFKISAWLHDCGKIITPEHIVDKGSKLETIYNRIHEVRMRFEVLWRDAEIQYYQALITQPDKKHRLQQSLINQQTQLTEDFAFVANANIGGEFMSKENIEKLHDIATKVWQRNFDDSLGLSPREELHLASYRKKQANTSSVVLPVTEQLLIDKAEHIFPRTQQIEFDDKLAIKISVPEHHANLGELYNLSISRGTLTKEDRYIINEHIIGTIKMLDQLPFPPELANVPKYASTHHETLIGTGYPRQLTAVDLTIPERILVIADIFEALTAADRPYKKGKSLSASVNILHKLAIEQHIDIDLFELFLTSDTYLVYANKYMKKEQIDDVDITKHLRT